MDVYTPRRLKYIWFTIEHGMTGWIDLLCASVSRNACVRVAPWRQVSSRGGGCLVSRVSCRSRRSRTAVKAKMDGKWQRVPPPVTSYKI